MSLGHDTADVKALLGAAAAKISKVRYAWLLTSPGEGGVRPRPMGRLPRDAEDDEWRLRFITDGRSPKVADMRREGRVSVIFQHDPDDVFVAVTGKASLVEDKPEIRRRWAPAYNVYFPAGPDQSSAIFVTIDAISIELWIRGVTSEPFGLRTTVIERDAARGWQLRAG
jgi:general stress protein 26